MNELIQVGSRSYYIEGMAKIGLYRLNDTEVCLIDSGIDDEAGKAALELIAGNGWRLKTVVNTHGHADHVGGNRYLQQHTGCRIFMNSAECAITQHPLLNTSLLYGGYPCGDMRNKLLLAHESDIMEMTHTDFPSELEPVALHGHSMGMTGIHTPDDVLFVADALVSERMLERHTISFLYNVKEHLVTLDRMQGLSASVYVPSHAPATEDIGALTVLNREKIRQVEAKLNELCSQPATAEELTRRLFALYHLPDSMEQYMLISSTVRSYLSWMRDSGSLTCEVNDGRLLWRTV